jgi:hypothetical protein
MGFYETENLPTFSVKNQQTYLQQTAQNFRQYQVADVGGSYPAHFITLPETTSITNPYSLTLDQQLNLKQYEFRTPLNISAFAESGAGLLISATGLKRYYITINSKENASNANQIEPNKYDNKSFYGAVTTNYGFKNLPKQAKFGNDGNLISTEDFGGQIPPYFNLFMSLNVRRGTEILTMRWVIKNEAGDVELKPFYLFRNLYDFIGFGGVNGFPGPKSAAYTDPLGQATDVRFMESTRLTGTYWTD